MWALSPRASQGLVGGGGDQVGVLEGGGHSPGRHQATDVSHVRQEVGVQLPAQLEDIRRPFGQGPMNNK